MLRVNGGPANSGTVVKRERGGPWSHHCRPVEFRNEGAVVVDLDAFTVLPGYWVSCPHCGTKRP